VSPEISASNSFNKLLLKSRQSCGFIFASDNEPWFILGGNSSDSYGEPGGKRYCSQDAFNT
jgi:hypothetical protein